MCGAIAQGHDKVKLLRNLHFILPDGRLTVAAILLFAKYTQRWLPVMTAKCISFVGNFIGGTQFRDKVNDTDMEGNLLHQFETIMSFFTRNLKTIQVKKEFNSIGQLEIPYTCLVELVVNALVHRSYAVYKLKDAAQYHSWASTCFRFLNINSSLIFLLYCSTIIYSQFSYSFYLLTQYTHIYPPRTKQASRKLFARKPIRTKKFSCKGTN